MNPHMQRRLNARKERQRARPAGTTRYNFDLTEETTDLEPVEQQPKPAPRANRAIGTPTGRRAVRRYTEYSTEYGYVGGDLRRISVVSVLLLGLIGALALIIRP
jgi:hypothetical protein